jgi:hypothetical protein
MPIPVQCDCGRSLRIKDELAGRKVKCPQCAAVLLVPRPETAAEELGYELISDDAPEEEARPRRKAKSDPDDGVQTAPRSRRPAAADDDEDEEDPEEARRRRKGREDEERDEERRRSRRKKETRRLVEEAGREDRARRRLASTPSPSRRGFGTINAGVGGGIVMIVIGVVWLGIGLMAGWIFFYPVVLIVLGIIAVIRGATS